MKYISNPAKISFNPQKLEGKVKEIFEDKIARTLWIGIKQKHLTDQYFNMQCSSAANLIKEEGFSQGVKDFGLYLRKQFCIDFDKEFVEELYPYIKGEKELKYEIVN